MNELILDVQCGFHGNSRTYELYALICINKILGSKPF
jgi:hypothetical protein